MAKDIQVAQATEVEEGPTKMLGAHVDESLYWDFKNAAAARKEKLMEAIAHAARMYIDTNTTKGG